MSDCEVLSIEKAPKMAPGTTDLMLSFVRAAHRMPIRRNVASRTVNGAFACHPNAGYAMVGAHYRRTVMRRQESALLAVVATLIAATSAFAAPLPGCASDARRLCASVYGNDRARFQCMMQHRAELSAGCIAAGRASLARSGGAGPFGNASNPAWGGHYPYPPARDPYSTNAQWARAHHRFGGPPL
jgi:hypothetical protein